MREEEKFHEPQWLGTTPTTEATRVSRRRRAVPAWALLACVAAIGASLVPISASAQTFAPIACSTSTYTNVPFKYTSADFPPDRNCVPTVADPCPHYTPNYHNESFILANQYVNSIQIRYAKFETELNYDYFTYGPRLGSSSLDWGSLPANTVRTINASAGHSFQSEGALIRFDSDTIIGDEGFLVDRVGARCSATPVASTLNAKIGEVYRGVLLGTNDTVFTHVFNWPSSTRDMTFYIYGDAAGLNDIDVYARCNALPTATNYTVSTRFQAGQVDDFLRLDGDLCNGGIWYFAINSTLGAGQFNMLANSSYANEKGLYGLSVGTAYVANSATMLALETTVVQATRAVYSATEGTMHFPSVEVWNRGDCRCSTDGLQNCDVCLYNAPGTGFCCTGFPSGPDEDGAALEFYQVGILQGYLNSPLGVAHELLHSFLSRGDEGGTIFVDDEYSGGGSLVHCGHSIMAAVDTTQLCQASNHGDDPSPVGTAVDPFPSNWVEYDANFLTHWDPNTLYEPDTTDLKSRSFANGVGQLIRRW